MSKYVWLLSVNVGGKLVPARLEGVSPFPGDVVELKDGSLGRIQFGALYEHGEEQLAQAINLASPEPVVAFYRRQEVVGEDAP